MLRAAPPGHPLQKPTVVQWDIGAMLSADGAADESVSPQSGIRRLCMKFPTRRPSWLASVAFAMAWAGGAGFGDDDENSEEEGPSYFGFVRDSGGATIPDAKVTVGVKGRGGVVTRTDALGTYKVPGFGKDIDPKDVEVSCDKEGYRQVKTLRRMRSPNADAK